eukprot:gene12858-15196_t
MDALPQDEGCTDSETEVALRYSEVRVRYGRAEDVAALRACTSKAELTQDPPSCVATAVDDESGDISSSLATQQDFKCSACSTELCALKSVHHCLPGRYGFLFEASDGQGNRGVARLLVTLVEEAMVTAETLISLSTSAAEAEEQVDALRNSSSLEASAFAEGIAEMLNNWTTSAGEAVTASDVVVVAVDAQDSVAGQFSLAVTFTTVVFTTVASTQQDGRQQYRRRVMEQQGSGVLAARSRDVAVTLTAAAEDGRMSASLARAAASSNASLATEVVGPVGEASYEALTPEVDLLATYMIGIEQSLANLKRGSGGLDDTLAEALDTVGLAGGNPAEWNSRLTAAWLRAEVQYEVAALPVTYWGVSSLRSALWLLLHVLWIAVSIMVFAKEMARLTPRALEATHKQDAYLLNLMSHFSGYGNILAVCGACMQLTVLGLFFTYHYSMLHVVELSLRYHVYDDLHADANFFLSAREAEPSSFKGPDAAGLVEASAPAWTRPEDNSGLEEYAAKLQMVQQLGFLYQLFFMLQAGRSLIMMLRILNATTGQKRLAVVSKTLVTSFFEVIQCVPFFVSLACFAVMFNIEMGHRLAFFSTLSETFRVLGFFAFLGDYKSVKDEAWEDSAFQRFKETTYITLFVAMYMFFLGNFVLAIVCDSMCGTPKPNPDVGSEHRYDVDIRLAAAVNTADEMLQWLSQAAVKTDPSSESPPPPPPIIPGEVVRSAEMRYTFVVGEGETSVPPQSESRRQLLAKKSAGQADEYVRTTYMDYTKHDEWALGPMVDSFGIDTVFNPGSALFRPDLQDEVGWYYNTTPGSAMLNEHTLSPKPFALRPLLDRAPGVPLVIDTGLGARRAQELYTFIQDGAYIGEYTTHIEATMATWNAQRQTMGFLQLDWTRLRKGIWQ